MINWFDMPAEGLSNGGLFEVKELEVTENGTYEEKGEMYNKVVVNVEGGGTSWQTVFEDSVTTEVEGDYNTAWVEDVTPLTKDTIKVTFNGTEYECSKNEDDSYGAVMSGGTYDWSEYPFYLFSEDGGLVVNTQTAGTYTLKIEEQQSGGSSDWTKAIVRVKNNSSTALLDVKLDTFENDGFISAFLFKATIGVDTNTESIFYEANTDKTDTYYIYKNAYIILYSLSIADPEAFQVEGLAEILTIPEAPPFVKVTGDCTITINDVQ